STIAFLFIILLRQEKNKNKNKTRTGCAATAQVPVRLSHRWVCGHRTGVPVQHAAQVIYAGSSKVTTVTRPDCRCALSRPAASSLASTRYFIQRLIPYLASGALDTGNVRLLFFHAKC